MIKSIVMGLLPDDFWTHRRAAKRERLLGWRSVLDAAIERLDEEGAASTSSAGAGEAEATEAGASFGVGPGWSMMPVPPEFWSHHQAAHREDLLAVRSVVEACIGWLEKAGPPQQATRIEVL